MIPLRLIVALLLIVAAGLGTTMLLLRNTSRASVLECCALGWVLGTGVVSLMLWIAGFVVSGINLLIVVTVGCFALAAAGFLSAKQSSTQFTFPRPANSLEWLLAAILIVQVITVFIASFRHQLGWDGLLIWEAKARYAFLAGGSLPPTYFQSTSLEFTHVGYPLLLPFAETWCYLWMGEPHQFWLKAIFPLFYLAGVVLLGAAATRLARSRLIGGGIAALLFFVPYVTSIDGGVVVGYADFPLAVLFLGAVGYLVSFSTSGRPEVFRLSAACIMFLPWMKREGVILWLVTAACGALLAWRRKWTLLLWLLPGALIISAWWIYLASVHARVPTEYLPATLPTLTANLHRAGSICVALFAELARIEHWNIFWLLVLIALGVAFLRGRDLRLLLLVVAIVVPLAPYCGAYIFSNWPDHLAHMNFSLPRLLLQLMPVGWLLIALALRRTPDADQPSITSSGSSLTSAAPERGK